MSNALKRSEAVVKFSLLKIQLLNTSLQRVTIVCFFPLSSRYVDKTPKSLPARIYSAVWMIVGMIILSIFTAEVTSGLTSKELMPHHTHLGKKVTFLPSHLLCPREMIERLKGGSKTHKQLLSAS